MDLMLFPTYDLPSTRLRHVEIREPVITAERFAEWPEHMRREFALLAAEAGLKDAVVRNRTGITADALERARQSTRLFALSYSESRVLDEEEDRQSANKKRWKGKRRAADA
jgi:hypothetical protein